MLVIHKSKFPESLVPSTPTTSVLTWAAGEIVSSLVLLTTNSVTSSFVLFSRSSVTNCSCWTEIGTWIPDILASFISPSSDCFFSVSNASSVGGDTSGMPVESELPVEVTRAHNVFGCNEAGIWIPTAERRAASSRLKLLGWKEPMVVYMTSGSVSLALLPQLTTPSSAGMSPWEASLKSTVGKKGR